MKDYSQNGESKILEEILPVKGYFVDLGAGDGYHLSNTRYFKEKGWNGLMVDAKSGASDVCLSFIIMDNVLDILKQNGVPQSFDLLSLDLDGNDFWILDRVLTHYKPRVICFEINSQLPLDSCIVMPYNEDHFWDGTNAYGMSYEAGFRLCKKHGYKIYDIVNGANIIATLDQSVIPRECKILPTWSHPEKEIQWQEV